MTTMAVYALDRFAASEALAGFASSAYVFGALASRFAATALIARFGTRPVYLVGAAAATLACGLYFAVDSLWFLIAVRAVHGMTFGLAHSALGAMSQTRIPASRRGEGNGYFAMSSTVGTAIGPVLAVALTVDGGYVPLFIAATVISLISLAAGAAIRPLPADLAQSRTGGARPAWIARPAVPIGLVAFLQSLGYAALAAFLAEYTTELNEPAAAGWFFLVYAGCVLVVRAFAGPLYDRYGADVVFYPGLALYAIGFIVLATSPTITGVMIAAAAIGFGYGTLLPAGITIAAERIDPEMPGGAFTTYYVFVDLGYGLGPILLGFALGLWGWTGLFCAGLATVIAASAVYTLVRRPPRLETQLSDR